MNHKHCKLVCLSLFYAIFSGVASSAVESVTGKVHGNLGFFYTGTSSGEGAKSNSTTTTLSLNLNSYVWRPWFATYDIGGTGSMARNNSDIGSTSADLLTSHLNFSLLPRSRYPFRVTMSANDKVDEWLSSDTVLAGVGAQYRSRYLNARQSYITLAGNRLDGWYTNRSRNYSGIDLTDNTFGGKAQFRGKKQNLYANGSYQWRENSVNDDETKNISGAITHNYFPVSSFYIKTLASKVYTDDGAGSPDSSVFSDRQTNTDQLSSFFYWRPVYKPYSTTGGVRAYRRAVDLTNAAGTTQVGIDANLAGTYTITRRLNLTGTLSVSALQNVSDDATVADDARNSNQSVLLSYRSDRIRFRDVGYRWYASGGLGNSLDDADGNFNASQTLNASLGHSAQKKWVTGNRSSLRVNLNQSARESLRTEGQKNTALTLSHSASAHWNEEVSKGQFYSQLTVLDTRNIDDKTEMQIVNFQLSRTMPVSRLSQWGVHLSAQSSRRQSAQDEKISFVDGFLTTINGRLNYQHARMFGIYKLKFRSRLDVTSTANRDGGDRRQADLYGRLGYNVGKLSTALIGRGVFSETGLNTMAGYFQLNRSF